MKRWYFSAGVAVAATVLMSPWAAVAGSPATRTIYAAPGGSGSACTSWRPCSLGQAQQRVRSLDRDLRSDLVVRLAPGDYRLSRPLSLDARDSGSNGHRVIW